MNSNYSRLIFIVLLMPLSGCLSMLQDKPVEPEVPAVFVGPPKPAYHGTSTLELNNRAIDILYNGDTKQSMLYINAILEREPDSYVANILKDQINSDPNKFLGQNTYVYKVQADESLYTLAEKHLGDLLYFHALARISNIEQPAAIQAGDLVMIPSDGRLYKRVQTKLNNKNAVKPVISSSTQTTPAVNSSSEDEAKVSSLYNNGKYLEVVAYANQNPGLFTQPSTLTDNLGKSLLLLSQGAQENNQTFSAKIFLSRAQKLNTSPAVRNDITSHNKAIKVTLLTQRADAFEKKGQLAESIKVHQQVLKIEPNNTNAQKSITTLKRSLAAPQ